jgi:hypothetical protein
VGEVVAQFAQEEDPWPCVVMLVDGGAADQGHDEPELLTEAEGASRVLLLDVGLLVAADDSDRRSVGEAFDGFVGVGLDGGVGEADAARERGQGPRTSGTSYTGESLPAGKLTSMERPP